MAARRWLRRSDVNAVLEPLETSGRGPRLDMVVGIVVFELHLAGSRSLKEKRRVVQGLIGRLHHRYRVSVAETDHHDLHQRAELGIAVVGRSPSEVDHLLAELRRVTEAQTEAIVTRWDTDTIQDSPS